MPAHPEGELGVQKHQAGHEQQQQQQQQLKIGKGGLTKVVARVPQPCNREPMELAQWASPASLTSRPNQGTACRHQQGGAYSLPPLPPGQVWGLPVSASPSLLPTHSPVRSYSQPSETAQGETVSMCGGGAISGRNEGGMRLYSLMCSFVLALNET